MELDRQSGIPYYIQLKEQIRRRITQGTWALGTKLPTERELAGQLGVSRNTISQAYKELESEGVLSSAQGKGTFVADTSYIIQQEGRKEKVLRIIDMAMEEAVGLGFSIDDFISFVHVRGMEKKELLGRVKVGFIECNPEQLQDIHWNLGPGIRLIPILLSDIREGVRLREGLAAMDMLITGTGHLAEVKPLLQGLRVPLLGVVLQPKLETVVRVAKLPPGEEVTLVCESLTFARKVRESLQLAGLHPDLKVLTLPDEVFLKRVLANAGAVIVAPGWRAKVEKAQSLGLDVIEYRFEPDAGSLSLLRGALLELKKG